MPTTGTGVVDGLRVPSPRRPPAPQHWTEPLARGPQAWRVEAPPTTAGAVEIPLTATGVVDDLAGKPSPRNPCPQHFTEPSARTAQACDVPAPSDTTFVKPSTVTGTDDDGTSP